MNAKQLAAEIRDLPTTLLSPIAASLRCEQYRTFAELWFSSLGATDTRETRLVVADAMLDELARRTK